MRLLQICHLSTMRKTPPQLNQDSDKIIEDLSMKIQGFEIETSILRQLLRNNENEFISELRRARAENELVRSENEVLRQGVTEWICTGCGAEYYGGSKLTPTRVLCIVCRKRCAPRAFIKSLGE